VKDQYFGDINDYLKYGLLRGLVHVGWRVGVCWMLTPDDGRTDGSKVRYLGEPNLWRGHDAILFDALRSTVGAEVPRGVTLVEEGNLIPGARYFSRIVPDKMPERSAWFADSLTALAGCDLLFFDPDNGLEVPSRAKGRLGSSKYLYRDEIATAWQRSSASLLVFQHFAREERNRHIQRLVNDVAQMAEGAWAIGWRSAHVLFLLVCRPQHRSRAEEAVRLVQSRWTDQIVPI
jgi:hypothetical protein